MKTKSKGELDAIIKQTEVKKGKIVKK